MNTKDHPFHEEKTRSDTVKNRNTVQWPIRAYMIVTVAVAPVFSAFPIEYIPEITTIY